MVTTDTYRINELARFRVLLGGLGASVCLGTFYGFNLLTNYMQQTYNFSSRDLTTISTTALVVSFVTFPNGMLLDYAGPMYVCIIACVCSGLGALLFGLAFNGFIAASTVRFSVFCAIFNLGCTSFDTGSLMAILGSFPLSKGLVVGTMKTLGGLSAPLLAVTQYSLFRTHYAAYMYFMTALIVGLGSLAAIFIRFPPYHILDCERTRVSTTMQRRRRLTEYAYLTQRPPLRRLYLGFVLIIILLVYLMTQSLCVAYVPSITDRDRLAITIVALCLTAALGLVAAPLPFLGGMDKPYSNDYPELPLWFTDTEDDAGDTVAATAMADRPVSSSNNSSNDSNDHHHHVHGNSHSAQLAPRERAPYANEGKAYVANAIDVEDAARDEVAVTHTSHRRRHRGGAVDDEVVYKSPSTMMTREAYESVLASQRVSSLDPQYEGSFWSHLTTVDLWLLFWNTFAVWGCGLVVSMNSAQIYRALNNNVYEMKTNTLYSSIIGIGSGLGRISMGIFEYLLMRYEPSSRPVVTVALPIPSACMVVGVLLLAVLPQGSKAIIVGFFLDAFGNGFSWSCNAITMRSIYARDIGKHYNFMFFAALISVIALNRFAYGELYDHRARQQDAQRTGPSIYPLCAGLFCVRDSLIILACVNFTAVIGSVLCHIRYRRFVIRYRAELARNAAAAAAAAAATADVADGAGTTAYTDDFDAVAPATSHRT